METTFTECVVAGGVNGQRRTEERLGGFTTQVMMRRRWMQKLKSSARLWFL